MSNPIVQSGTDLVRQDTGEIVGVTTFSMPDYLASVTTDGAFQVQQQLAAAYDKACLSLIGPNDVQTAEGRTFKKKSAWRKLARHFNISTEVKRVERDTANGDFIATVTVCARAPWGQSAEAVGACGTDEATGRRVITIADAIATAETRATNRAVSNLIAMGEVSAEEMSGKSAEASHRPATTTTGPSCPKCGGSKMYDNRAENKERIAKKLKPRPDFKCATVTCGGVIWPSKDAEQTEALADAESGRNGYLDALAAG